MESILLALVKFVLLNVIYQVMGNERRLISSGVIYYHLSNPKAQDVFLIRKNTKTF